MPIYQSLRTDSLFNAYVNLQDSTGTGITSTNVAGKQGLDVNVISSMGSVGIPDESTFTYGSTSFLPVGGVYNPSVVALTAGQSGSQQLTAFRATKVNLNNALGNEIGAATGSPVFTQDVNGTLPDVGNITNPTFGLTTSVVLAANPNRKGYFIYNPTQVTAFVSDAPTSSLTLYTRPYAPHSGYEPVKCYTGAISAIAAATGTLFVTEYVV